MTMSNQNQNQPVLDKTAAKTPNKPNEHGSIVVQAHMKIFDPKTQQVFVEGRA